MRAASSRCVATCRTSRIVIAGSSKVSRTSHLRRLQLFRLVARCHLVDELVELAVEHGFQTVRSEVDAMMGDAILWEVVCSDFLAALAAADLGTPRVGDFTLALAFFDFVQPGAHDR